MGQVLALPVGVNASPRKCNALAPETSYGDDPFGSVCVDLEAGEKHESYSDMAQTTRFRFRLFTKAKQA